MNAGGGKVAIVSVGELYLLNAGGGKAAIVSVGELYLLNAVGRMVVKQRIEYYLLFITAV